MKLNDQERKILVAAQYHASCTIEEIAKRAGVKAHVANYVLKQLQQKEIIRSGTLININLIGLKSFQIYFALQGASQSKREKLLKAIAGHSNISWYAEIGGSYQFGISIVAGSATEASSVFSKLIEKCNLQIANKEVAAVLKFITQQKLYLHPQTNKEREILSVVDENNRITFDELDLKLLAALSSPAVMSHRDIARRLGIPRTTVDRRLTNLHRNGAIVARMYFISAVQCGYQNYKVKLSSRGSDTQVEKQIAVFAYKNINVVNWSRCFGAWDFELGIEVESGIKLTTITDSLMEQLGDSIHSMMVAPVFKQSYSSAFLSTIKS